MKEKMLDLLALMPCPLKVSFEKEITETIKTLNEYYDIHLEYKIVSNAVAQTDIFEKISHCKDINELPNIMIAPGFSRFFYKEFVKLFRDKGKFSNILEQETFLNLELIDIFDPDNYYSLIAFNPLVFLVDKTNNPKLPTPKKWGDLLTEEYEAKVAYRGHSDSQFCEGVLLNIYKELGDEGIFKLAKSVKCRLHPSQMVKFAGSKMKEAPAVSVIPYSFACMVGKNKNVEIIWPEDGAIINPLVMLVKTDCSQAVKDLANKIADKDIEELFLAGGFFSIYNQENMHNMGEHFRWLGWDFIINNNLEEILDHLNQIMFNVINTRNTTDLTKEGDFDCK
ncbi:ABC transporter substrate-binding protein [[Clostridium] fimetarium]|uniref:ABC-type Fe3+ transport system, substrate-binding protein n=1 Tax=[Clostridium] fimetarium TaxID=99656 RepID=A0A1I0RXH2_9FIRM|nr:ABC transporter substrate-binding protein [[Clostridium] fimetarium]SEW46160.1 ABC-type Fe3+ transport system, substrate-binding protein [[Clostridium] fimetarium]